MTNERLDMANNPVRVGDFVAFVTGGGKRRAELSFGRVVRLTGKGVAVREVWWNYNEKVWNGLQLQWEPREQGWYLEDETIAVSKKTKFLYISQHSLPKEVFAILDALEIL